MTSVYPIGRQGQPWNADEKDQWFAAQKIKRSYLQEVVARFDNIATSHEVHQYGVLPKDPKRQSEHYPLFAIKPKQPNPDLPDMLVTGGVHGYETSGVQGALDFACKDIERYSQLANIYILPCISPWGYETINRWGANAVDPNRNFFKGSPSLEANLAMSCVKELNITPLLHIDLHETTDSDNSEFRPALAARDAIHQEIWQIPDGFYLVADTQNPQLAFQSAIIQAVQHATHIAPSDENNKIIGVPISSEGIIDYDKGSLNLCARMTKALYVTTTEVYPDSPNTNAHECNAAQVVAVASAIDFVLNTL